MKKVLESSRKKAPAAPSSRISESEFQELCACIQAVDRKKIKDFFKRIEDKWTGRGLNNSYDNPKITSIADIREAQLECIILLIEARNFLCAKVPALKAVLDSDRDVLSLIMKSPRIPDIIKITTDAAIKISNGLPMLSAENNMHRIVAYVNANYNEDLKLKSLGRLFNYNSAYLGKCFKKHTGKSLHNYLDMLRVNKAKEMLSTTDMKVYEVSYAVGYSNTDYFYTKFRRLAGESPLFFKEDKDIN